MFIWHNSNILSRWLVEIERKQAEMVAAQVALEKLRHRDQLLTTENEMLKVQINSRHILLLFVAETCSDHSSSTLFRGKV